MLKYRQGSGGSGIVGVDYRADGFTYTIETSTNLVNWPDLFSTNPLVLPFNWADADTTNLPKRFYRVRQAP